MPTYDYRCERTGEIFEIWQAFSDDALTTCPQHHDGTAEECRGPVKRVFSKVGIAFKGDGFYKTDHRVKASDSGSDNGSSTSTDSSGSSSPDSGSSPKSDTKKKKKETRSESNSSSSTSSD